jgi:hypothetical protein
MLYHTETIGGKDYKFRLDAKACVSLEKKLKRNPLAILIESAQGTFPTITDIIAILQASLSKYQHGIDEDAVFDLYDRILDEGKEFADIMSIIMKIFEVSGLYKPEETKETSGEESIKN